MDVRHPVSQTIRLLLKAYIFAAQEHTLVEALWGPLEEIVRSVFWATSNLLRFVFGSVLSTYPDCKFVNFVRSPY